MPAQQGPPSTAAATRPKPSKPAAPTTDYLALIRAGLAPPDYAGLAKTANTMAGNSVGAQVAGIRAAQDQIRQSAGQQATQVTEASLAAAKYLQSLNLGGAVAGDYAQAAEAQRAAAAGYSGGLQQQVGDEAWKVQQNLAGLGSTQNAAPNSQAAGNVLYGLGGNLPAQQLDVQGPLQAAQIRGLPAQTVGYGQQLATGALGAGAAEANKLNPDIVAAEAKRATLSAQYLAQLEKAARDAGQDRIANTLKVLKLQQADQAAQALADYHASTLDETHRAHTLSYNASVNSVNAANARNTADNTSAEARAAASIAAANARTAASIAAANARNAADNTAANSRNDADNARLSAQYTAQHSPTFNTSTSKVNRFYSDQYGNPLAKDSKGRPLPIPGYHYNAGSKLVADKKTGGAVSATLVNTLSSDLRDWHTGVTGTANGLPVRDDASKLNWTQAYARAVARVGPEKAKQMVNAEYGSPKKIAYDTVLKGKQEGAPLMEAVSHVLEAQSAGQLPVPLDYAVDALARVYRAPKYIVLQYMTNVGNGVDMSTASPAYG